MSVIAAREKNVLGLASRQYVRRMPFSMSTSRKADKRRRQPKYPYHGVLGRKPGRDAAIRGYDGPLPSASGSARRASRAAWPPRRLLRPEGSLPVSRLRPS
jgi:hypothetical protein